VARARRKREHGVSVRLQDMCPRERGLEPHLPSTESAAGAAPQVVFCLTCSQILEITTEPSPTAEATRFTDPARTSPTAKMPG
jgi:hypothetical protein